MADNTVKTEDGAEIYINNIYYYVDQYIEDIKQSPKHIEDKNYISTIDELKDKAIFKGFVGAVFGAVILVVALAHREAEQPVRKHGARP